MPLFEKSVQVFSETDISVGDLDYTASGCYRNVVTRSFDVKPKRVLFVKISSDKIVDVVVANSDGSAAAHKEGITDYDIGPIITGNNKNMGILLGVYLGDKAKVNVEIRMEKK